MLYSLSPCGAKSEARRDDFASLLHNARIMPTIKRLEIGIVMQNTDKKRSEKQTLFDGVSVFINN